MCLIQGLLSMIAHHVSLPILSQNQLWVFRQDQRGDILIISLDTSLNGWRLAKIFDSRSGHESCIQCVSPWSDCTIIVRIISNLIFVALIHIYYLWIHLSVHPCITMVQWQSVYGPIFTPTNRQCCNPTNKALGEGQGTSVTYISVSKPTLQAVAGPNWQLSNETLDITTIFLHLKSFRTFFLLPTPT